MLTDIGIVDGQFNVYDGVRASNCDGINKLQLSHNAGMLLEGSAYLYSYVCLETPDPFLLGLSLFSSYPPSPNPQPPTPTPPPLSFGAH